MASPLDVERLYQEGVAAIRAGDRITGRQKLSRVVELDQLHERAWLWLSLAVDDTEEQIICLENVLTINPTNEKARQALQRLQPPPPTEPSPQAPPTTSVPSEAGGPPLAEPPLPTTLLPRLLAEGWLAAALLMRHDHERERVSFGLVLLNLLLGSLLSWVGSILISGLAPQGSSLLPDAVEQSTFAQIVGFLIAPLSRAGSLVGLLVTVILVTLGEMLFSLLMFTGSHIFKGEGGYLQNLHIQTIGGSVQRLARLGLAGLLVLVAQAAPERLEVAFMVGSALWALYVLALRVNAVASANPNLGIEQSVFVLFLSIGMPPTFLCLIAVIIPTLIRFYTTGRLVLEDIDPFPFIPK